MKVLLLGSGAREHALALSLSSDPAVEHLLALPGNPGIAEVGTCLAGDPCSPEAVTRLARAERVDLVVVGPEAPLVAGVADAVVAAGIPCFGPSAAAARLEGSKAFAKEVMAAAAVPTASCHVCGTDEEVAAALAATGAPYVVKEDGLAAGKGVVVTADRGEAAAHAAACLSREGGRVVVEDYLDGPEVSLFCLSDGTTVVPLAPAQDFKRVGDGDTGPNTGGMGAYSPLPWAPEGLVEEVLRTVARPTVEEMARRGTPFVGVLYVGIALTAAGPRVVEFNARFGDPETQSVLARLETPLAGVLLAAAEGRLADLPPLEWSPRSSVTVVVAAEGYPGSPVTGREITGLEEAGEVEGVHVLHAGTRRDEDGRLLSSGGRVLSVVSVADDLAGARERAYGAVHRIHLEGSHHRGDISRAAEQGGVEVPLAVVWPTTGEDGESPVEVVGHELVHSGKVRGLYVPLDPQTGGRDDLRLLLAASDRISAYDHVLSTPIPDKGSVLTQMSLWWFDQLADLVPHHVVSTDVPEEVAGRGVYVRRLRMLPVECVARAYLTGGGLAEYAATGTVSGVALPEGLVDGSRLPEPVFTPSTKAPVGEHDQPISFTDVEALVGPRLAARLRDLTVAILVRGNEIAAGRGILIADTKVEFGVDPQQLADALGIPLEQATEGEVDWAGVDPDVVAVVLADEVLTPDSSRFWRADEWAPGRTQTSYDKQVLRDWLTSPASGWDRASDAPPPPLPDDVVALTRDRYVEAYETLTGRAFDPSGTTSSTAQES
ncbi:phosphoribosylamine--glycine ligase [Ornithinimicrobium avium]|uniref:Multifunctional fusion protein n=1 Tax=Ornithinimicrobium avium TaxID=2283195 RepID=A0A345NPZ1_9MICO|nr:phosphoribosylamine--glycine ligase [Ornithinimicrobium avium]AXH97099.1 phosphoribosylamine--glycine ligase [Ornithinimicrobium avium]